MARGIRFTKAEREVIRAALDDFITEVPKPPKAAHTALAKLDLAELPVKKGTYLTTSDAIAAFREVLGQRLLAPGFQAVGVLAQMKNRIQALGLTRQDCTAIAKAAGAEWQGVIRAESLVRQADKLLAGSQLALGQGQRTPQSRSHSPVELGDDEI